MTSEMKTTVGFVAVVTPDAKPYSEEVCEAAAAKVILDASGIPDEIITRQVILNVNPEAPDEWLKAVHEAGIRPREEDDADDVLAEILAFLADCDRIVAVDYHNDVRALYRDFLGRRAVKQWLTFEEAARVAFPTSGGHDPLRIAEHLGPPWDDNARATAPLALERVKLAAKLWPPLVNALVSLPSAVLTEMTWVLGIDRSPLKYFIQQVATDAATEHFQEVFKGEPVKLSQLLRDFSDIVGRRRRKTPDEEAEEDEEDWEPSERVSEKGVREFFAPDGVLAKKLDGYEFRRQQVDMAVRVAKALNDGELAVIEAGTGVGKSLAYLVPAILFAVANNTPVVISTNTKNLQGQLKDKDIPFLEKHLPCNFTAAVIKGRANYLCIRKLFELLEVAQKELEPGELRALPPLIHWAFTTETGDREELTGLPPEIDRRLWEKLHTVGDDCLGRACRRFRNCFVYRARLAAQNANVAVTNHAMVFSDLNLEKILPKHRHIIFDEAHNIESVATDHLTIEVNKWRFFSILNRLYRRKKSRSRRETHGGGLIPRFLNALTALRNRDGIDKFIIEKQHERAIVAMQAVEIITSAVGDFFKTLDPLFVRRNVREDKKRFSAGDKPQDIWRTIEKAKHQLVAACAQLTEPLEKILNDFKPLLEARMAGCREFRKELEAHAGWISDLVGELDFTVAGDREDFVFWVEARDTVRHDYTIYAAPLEVAPLLEEQLYSQRRTVVLTSATLTCAGDFRFINNRLGVDLVDKERVVSADVGTPFDFQQQVELLVAGFLPDPRRPEFDEELAKTCIEVITAAGGRALCLYTSYASLIRAEQLMAPALERRGIAVHAQTPDASRELLLDNFKRDENSVLLGTASFWEGVDVPGRSLSLLLIAKLPFAVYTDPILKARADHIRASRGEDPFLNFSVPSAVLRWRQGFGRLIRHRHDTGVVIACDKRLISMFYGRKFLEAVPVQHLVMKSRRELARRVAETPKLHPNATSAPRTP